MKSIAKKKNLAKVICDYLLFVDHNPKKALELSIESESNWWWKSKQGTFFYFNRKVPFFVRIKQRSNRLLLRFHKIITNDKNLFVTCKCLCEIKLTLISIRSV